MSEGSSEDDVAPECRARSPCKETGAADTADASSVGQAADDAADDTFIDAKSLKKAAKKAAKAEKRAIRAGTADPSVGQKPCDVCERKVDLLIRCQVDATEKWKVVCGKCWNLPTVAGGVVDGSGENPHYRYGGLWKNLRKQSKHTAEDPDDITQPLAATYLETTEENTPNDSRGDAAVK